MMQTFHEGTNNLFLSNSGTTIFWAVPGQVRYSSSSTRVSLSSIKQCHCGSLSRYSLPQPRQFKQGFTSYSIWIFPTPPWVFMDANPLPSTNYSTIHSCKNAVKVVLLGKVLQVLFRSVSEVMLEASAKDSLQNSRQNSTACS